MAEPLTEDRLRNLEVASAEILVLLRNLDEKMGARIAASDGWRARVDKILIGDGNGQKGHNVRLDRLEQGAERSKWVVRSLLVPVILMALKGMSDMMLG